MARQEINVGAAPNDGTGDTLRDALIKVNLNLKELYPTQRVTRPGKWYPIAPYSVQSGSAANGTNVISFTPFQIFEATAITALGVRVVTPNGTLQCAVYASGGEGLPAGPAIASTLDIVSSSAGPVEGAITATTLQPGVYWFGVNASNAAVTLTCVSTSHGWGSFFSGQDTLERVINGQVNLGCLVTAPAAYQNWPVIASCTVDKGPVPRQPLGAFKTAA